MSDPLSNQPMSNQPAPDPMENQIYEPSYQTPTPYGSAPTLVKVTAILNFVMCGIDILWGLFLLVLAIVVFSGLIPAKDYEDMFSGSKTPPPQSLVGAGMLVISLPAFLAGALKLTGGVKLMRRGRGAWGWGLASGIVGCVQLWCSYLCVLPLALGVFTIVVMSLETTRRYLSSGATTAH